MTVAIETNGTLLNEKLIDELVDAGLQRINLTINTLDTKLAKELAGCEWYDVNRIVEIAKYIAESKLELILTPVWLPGVNDSDMPKLIEFSKQIKNKRWPQIGIQKYEIHKHGRKYSKAKFIGWKEFYRKLKEWEREFNVKLKLSPADFGIKKSKLLPKLFKINQKIWVEIKALGWIKHELLGVAKQRCITLINCKANIGQKIRARVISNKDNIYLVFPC